MKQIERLLSVLAWLQVFFSPAIIGSVAGGIIWLALRGSLGLTIGIIVALAGWAAGIVFAEKARRRKGTIEFMSRNIGHPELREKKSNEYNSIK